jgi:hypothetical protein
MVLNNRINIHISEYFTEGLQINLRGKEGLGSVRAQSKKPMR